MYLKLVILTTLAVFSLKEQIMCIMSKTYNLVLSSVHSYL